MQEASYKIHGIRQQIRKGITGPSPCTLHAVLKFDSQESLHCVYNEQVAVRLAQTLHIPIADGVLTIVGDGQAFASLEVASPGIALPDILKSQIKQVAAQYPNEAAALVAFDLLIGNWDRSQNLKASLVTPHLPIFKAFDHSHALLGIEEDPLKSISRLKSMDCIVKFHPFFGLISRAHLKKWLARITSLDAIYIKECCLHGRSFRAVGTEVQEALAIALVWRKENLEAITSAIMDKVTNLP